MRNYIQHYDMPPLAISLKEQIGQPVKIDIKINMSELYEDKEIYRKLSKNKDVEIENLDLMRVIEEWSNSFDRIAKKASLDRAIDTTQSAEYLIGIRNDSETKDGQLALIFFPHIETRPEKISLDINQIDDARASYIIDFVNESK